MSCLLHQTLITNRKIVAYIVDSLKHPKHYTVRPTNSTPEKMTISLIFLLLSANVFLSNAKPLADDIRAEQRLVNPQVILNRNVGNGQCCFMTKCEEIQFEDDNHSAFQCYQKKVCGGDCLVGRRRRI